MLSVIKNSVRVFYSSCFEPAQILKIMEKLCNKTLKKLCAGRIKLKRNYAVAQKNYKKTLQMLPWRALRQA